MFIVVAASALLNVTLQPELWGEGSISTPLDEFGGALSPNGSEFYFSVSVPRFFLEAICRSNHTGHGWSKPKIVPWSGVHHEFDPCLSPDGKTLFFISDRPIHKEVKTDYDVWKVEKRGRDWSAPIHLPDPVNGPSAEHFASCAANGDLFVCSDRDGKSSKVWRFPYEKDRYGKGELLPDTVNGEGGYTLEASISPDGKVLVTATIGRKDSLGLYDLYISFKTATGWTSLQNLGSEINSSARDYTPHFSPDGRWLFYTSEKGFAQTMQGQIFTRKILDKGGASIMNGYGNIYRLEVSQLLKRFGR